MRSKTPQQANKILAAAAQLFATHRFHEARMEVTGGDPVAVLLQRLAGNGELQLRDSLLAGVPIAGVRILARTRPAAIRTIVIGLLLFASLRALLKGLGVWS